MTDHRRQAGDETPEGSTRRPHARSGSHFSNPDVTPLPRPVTNVPQRGGQPAATKPGSAAVPLSPFSAGSSNGRSAVDYGSGQVRSSVGPDPASDAPRPIGVDPAATGSFSKLSANEGAVIPTRDTAAEAADAARESLRSATGDSVRMSNRRRPVIERPHESLKKDKRVFVILGIAVVAVIVGVFILVRNAAVSTTEASTSSYDQKVEVAPDSSVTYGDYTFTLSQQADGKWGLVRSSSTAETTAGSGAAATAGTTDQVTLLEVDGTPVSLVVYNGTFYIGENLDGGTWDVICYVMGDGSMASQLMESETDSSTGTTDTAVGGSGTLVSSSLDGTHLVLTDDAGKVTTVNLG